MELKSTRAFKIIRQRRETFDEAFRILFGESYDKSFESWRATRRLAVIVHSWEDEFDDKTPRGADGHRLPAEGSEAKFAPWKPPRAAGAIQMLAQIEDASHVLRQRLRQFDNQFLIYAGGVVPNSVSDSQSSKIIDQSGLFEANADSELSPFILNRKLLALEEGCRTLSGVFPADRGGRTNLEIEAFGNPKARLAYEVGDLFVKYRPGVISPNPEGPYYRLFGALYEVLTGQEPEGPGAGLKKYVEFAAPRMSRVEVNSARRMELFFARQVRRLNADEERELHHLQVDGLALHEELQMGPPSGHTAP